MSWPPPLPGAARPFLDFAALLRAHGFAVAPEQVVAFLEAVELLGPRHVTDIRRAAVATMAPPRERIDEFLALFAAHFLGEGRTAPAEAGEGEAEPLRVQEEAGGEEELRLEVVGETKGEAASPAEALGLRRFASRPAARPLERFRREAPRRLPRRRGAGLVRAKRGPVVDLARSLRRAAAREGELLALAFRRRRVRQRRLVLLIDVSGSMKEQSEANLRFAHALARAAERLEVLTFGTRLTRVTPALRLRSVDRALERAARTVRDWDGGTRIGEALAAFLRVPRLVGFARGAVVIVLSDGLERGDPELMVRSVERLSRLAHRLVWANPLAPGPGWRPETQAMRAVLPHLDALLPAGSVATLCREVLALARDLGERRRAA